MVKKYHELRARMSPASRKKSRALATAMARQMPLHELRAARRLSQAALAERLDTTQSSVSKLEKRTDMYLSTLRAYIEAMGGRLEITARFPDGSVEIERFAGLGGRRG